MQTPLKTSILIVTFERDFGWLHYCLKSIAKYATGFKEVVVVIPEHTPWPAVVKLIEGYNGPVPIYFEAFAQWPGKGFVHHAERIIHADQICPYSDLILHMDSDCVFIAPVTPEDYMQDGKPVLIHARYDWIVQKFNNPNHYHWQTAVQNAIGGKPEREFMRRQPALHWRYTYVATRALIQKHTGLSASDYIQTTRNEFPMTFAEFPLLGEVAWRHGQEDYFWIDQEKDQWPKDKLIQCWSHSPMDKPNNVWIGGVQETMIPTEVFAKYL